MTFVAGRRLARGLWLGASVAILGAVLSLLPWTLELDENAGLGWLFARRGALPPPESPVVVGVSRAAAEALGVSRELDEWPRALHAELIAKLSAAGAALIVFDMFFDEPRTAADDERLAAAIAAAGNVILLERVDSDTLALSEAPRVAALVERRHLPIEPLKKGALASAPFTLPVVPLRTNQFWTFGRGAGDTPTLPVVALQAFLLDEYEHLLGLLRHARPEVAADLPQSARDAAAGGRLEDVVRRLREVFRADPSLTAEIAAALGQLGDDEAAHGVRALLDVYAGDDHRYLSYYGPARTVRTVSYDSVLRGAAEGLAGKVVFVGYSESRQPDQQDAFISVFSERSGQNLSGVEIGATAFANLLERRRITPLPIGTHVAVVLAFGLLAGVAFSMLPVGAAIGAAALAASGYAALAAWQFSSTGLWLPLVVPVLVQVPVALLGAVLWTYHHTRSQRERIEAAFGYYLPAHEVRRFAEQHVDAGLSGELQYGTCLLTDVERYASVSERLDPHALRELLNRYYAVLLEVVGRHGGLVTDFAGDSLVAVWGGPKPEAERTAAACTCALDIVAAVNDFNRSRGVQLPTAVGLDTGLVLLGNVGAGSRYQYRAVGDIVTTSSRLQGLNRLLGTRVLASAQTVRASGGTVASRELGRFLLRGRTEALVVHELLDGSRSQDEGLLQQFAEALAAVARDDLGTARKLFGTLASRYPDDAPTRFYAALCDGRGTAGATVRAGVVLVETK